LIKTSLARNYGSLTFLSADSWDQESPTTANDDVLKDLEASTRAVKLVTEDNADGGDSDSEWETPTDEGDSLT